MAFVVISSGSLLLCILLLSSLRYTVILGQLRFQTVEVYPRCWTTMQKILNQKLCLLTTCVASPGDWFERKETVEQIKHCLAPALSIMGQQGKKDLCMCSTHNSFFVQMRKPRPSMVKDFPPTNRPVIQIPNCFLFQNSCMWPQCWALKGIFLKVSGN